MKIKIKQRIKSGIALILALLLAWPLPGNRVLVFADNENQGADGSGQGADEVLTEDISFTVEFTNNEKVELISVKIGDVGSAAGENGSYAINAGTPYSTEVEVIFKTDISQICNDEKCSYTGLDEGEGRRSFAYCTTVGDIVDDEESNDGDSEGSTGGTTDASTEEATEASTEESNGENTEGKKYSLILELTAAETCGVEADENITIKYDPAYWGTTGGYYKPLEGESFTIQVQPNDDHELTSFMVGDENVLEQLGANNSFTINAENAGNIKVTVLPTMFKPEGIFDDETGKYRENGYFNESAQITYTIPGDKVQNDTLQYLIINDGGEPDSNSDQWKPVTGEVLADNGKQYTITVPYGGQDESKIYVRYVDVNERYSDLDSSKPIRFDGQDPALIGVRLVVNNSIVGSVEKNINDCFIGKNDTAYIQVTASDDKSGLNQLSYTIGNESKEVYPDEFGVFLIPYSIDTKVDQITYQITDKAGNKLENQTINTSGIKFDLISPTAEIIFLNSERNEVTDISGWLTEEIYIEVKAEDRDPAPEDTEQIRSEIQSVIILDGENNITSNEGATQEGFTNRSQALSTGIHQINIQIFDNAGNPFTISREIKIDADGIQEQGVVFANNTGQTAFYEDFDITAEAESFSGIQKMTFTFFDETGKQVGTPIQVNDVSENIATIPFPAMTLGDFKGSVQVTYVDNCNRSLSGGSYPFSYNKEGASIRITAKERWSNTSERVTIEVSDAITDIEQLDIYVDGRLVETKRISGNRYTGEILVSDTSSSALGTQIRAVATSRSGKQVTSYAVVRIDKQAPVIRLEGMTEGGIYNSSRNLQITTIENIWNEMSPVTVRATRTLDGVTTNLDLGSIGVASDSHGEIRRFTDDGVYQVTVTAVDAAGNRAMETISFTIDRTAPQISINGVREGDYSSNAVTVNFQAIESFFETNSVTINVQRRLNGTTYGSTVNFTNTGRISNVSRAFTEDGDYTITMTAVDRAGNVATPQTVNFTVDRTAPVVSLSGTRDYFVTGSEVTLNFSVIEAYFETNQVRIQGSRRLANGRTVTLQIPDWINSGRISTLSQSFTEDGYYTITISAVDRAGNRSEQVIHFTIDTQAPVIDGLDQYDGKYLHSFRLQEKLEDMISELTVPTVRMTLNGEAYNGEEITADGKYTLTIEVTDEVGLKTVKSVEFVIDNTAPRIIFAGVEDRKTYTEVVNLNLALENENDEIIEILINGEPYALTAGSSSYNLTFDSYGRYEVVVTAIDQAGNEGSQSIVFTYSEYRNSIWLWILIVAAAIAAALIVVIAVRSKKK